MIQVLKANGQILAEDVICATNSFSQLKGLMFKKNLPDKSAMLFALKKPSAFNIHMLFMRFPLDIVVLDENKRIQKISTLKPWSGLMWVTKAKYVIEMNAGQAAKHNLSIGDAIQIVCEE